MTAWQCFGVVLRTFGLILLLCGVYYLFTAAYTAIVSYSRPHSPPGTYAVYGIAYCLVSLYFLRGAPGLAGFCYPQLSETE